MKTTAYKLGVIAVHVILTLLMEFIALPLFMLVKKILRLPFGGTIFLVTACVFPTQLFWGSILFIIGFAILVLLSGELISEISIAAKAVAPVLPFLFSKSKHWSDACFWWFDGELVGKSHYAYDMEKKKFLYVKELDGSLAARMREMSKYQTIRI